jgi:hypothetical protein
LLFLEQKRMTLCLEGCYFVLEVGSSIPWWWELPYSEQALLLFLEVDLPCPKQTLLLFLEWDLPYSEQSLTLFLEWVLPFFADLGHRRKKKICSTFLWGNTLGWDEGITGIRPKLGISMWSNAIRWGHYQNWVRTRPLPHVGSPSHNALIWGYYPTLLYLAGMLFKFGNALACNQGLRTVCLGLGEVCSRMVVNLNLQWARNWCKDIIPMRYCEKLWTSDEPCVPHFAQLIGTGVWRQMRV